ncbi:MAG: 23S rRNA (pseudouridine(1915)-N(3))-methyltransferase RlmH [Coprococcus sp.]
MIFNIACVGRIKENYYRELIDKYIKALSSGNKIIIHEVPDEPIPKKAGDSINKRIIHTEGDRLLEVIGDNDYVVALCIEGKQMKTEELADLAAKAEDKGYGDVTFVIGGSLGLDDRCIKRADYKLSFSKMTYPHQLMRVMLAEQIKLICDM